MVAPIALAHTKAKSSAIVPFVTGELFVLIYLQRFAVFTLSIPMLAMIAGVGVMAVTGRLSIDHRRLAVYLLFVFCCLISFAFVGGSATSVAQLLVLYACMVVRTEIPDADYEKIVDRFIKLMIVPAGIMIFQYSYQILTGKPNFVSMNAVVSQSILLQGYFYEAHYPWYSSFTRSNGFFFLEPSFASAFTAAATIMEITYFRRPLLAILMAVATIISFGATGLTMLIVAAPILLIRERPVVIAAAVASVLTVVVMVVFFNVSLPLMSRMNELGESSASGGERITLPAEKFAQVVFDPTYMFVGEGAGTAVKPVVKLKANGAPKTDGIAVINPWPIVKVVTEYGLMSMIAYCVLFSVAIMGNFNLPLKVALSIEFMFTGGYLVNPPFLGMFLWLLFAVIPASAKR